MSSESPSGPRTLTAEDEVANPRTTPPHFVLLGAGASKAAIPNGDKNGRAIPLLRDVALELDLANDFPVDLQQLAVHDFEAAYSRLYHRCPSRTAGIEAAVAAYFRRLRLPDEANLYDALLLSLRSKDAVFTFNWDPLLYISRVRLNQLGLENHLPNIFFLHGNVVAAYCEQDGVFGYTNGICSRCGRPFTPTRLLFPIEQKDYNTDPGIREAWRAAELCLEDAFMLTAFGYSAPRTDVEAFDLLKGGWGSPTTRQMEQIEIIHRPGADTEALLQTWQPFIHSHHCEMHDSFYDSWLGNHPRRSGEAHWEQYYAANFISANPIPPGITDVQQLADWFRPLIDAEVAARV